MTGALNVVEQKQLRELGLKRPQRRTLANRFPSRDETWSRRGVKRLNHTIHRDQVWSQLRVGSTAIASYFALLQGT